MKKTLIKDWIVENKKMVDLVSLIRKILSSSNGCELIKNAHRFVISRKHLFFHRFFETEKIFPLK